MAAAEPGPGPGHAGARRVGEPERVVLFGHGQMARLVHFYLTHDSQYEVVALTVDREHIAEETVLGLPVVPFDEVDRHYPPDAFGMSVPILYSRTNRLRAEKYLAAREKGYRLVSYVSSRAVTWPGLVLGDNCLVLEGAIVQPFARVGDDVVVACGSIVGHDAVIGDHAFLAPGAVTLGFVRVGERTFLGANSTVRDGIEVAADCVVGAGVTIRRNTEPGQVFVGADDEPLAKRSDELGQWLTWAR